MDTIIDILVLCSFVNRGFAPGALALLRASESFWLNALIAILTFRTSQPIFSAISLHFFPSIEKRIIRALSLVKAADETNIIITCEEHQVGGFGNIIAGVIAQNKKYFTPLIMDMIGVEDRFGESGAPWELTKIFGLTAEHIAQRAKELYAKKNSEIN